jgi:hypothetical protein
VLCPPLTKFELSARIGEGAQPGHCKLEPSNAVTSVETRMANERAPWMLTARQLREQLSIVDDDVVIALVQPASPGDALSVIRSVHVGYSGGPVLMLKPTSPPTLSGAETAHANEPERQPHPSDYFVEQFGYAIGRASCFELKMRLLAEKTPSLQASSFSAALTSLGKDIVSEYASALTHDERRLLETLPGIRNDLLHVELGRAQRRIKALMDAGIAKEEAQSSEMDRATDPSTTQRTLLGWLIEAGSSGSLRDAADLFFAGIVTVERLMSPSLVQA